MTDMLCEQVPLVEIAERFGTPCYVYSRAAIESRWLAFDRAFAEHAHLVCYAVKANSNLAVLNVLARLGSGFDIVSGGELQRVIAAGGDPTRVVFSGVGKTAGEMADGLEAGIRCFNVESEAELLRLNEVAVGRGKRAPVSIRVNPDVDPKTHPYISTGLKENKFGIAINQAPAVYAQARNLPGIELIGVDCHIGSQLIDATPVIDAAKRVRALYEQLAVDGIRLQHIDLGGGLGIRYADEAPVSIDDFIRRVCQVFAGLDVELIVEPGRAIVGNAGELLTRVEYLKHSADKNFAVVDAAMNDLARPSLYQAWHDIEPVAPGSADLLEYDIVGPICETGDFLGKSRTLALREGDLLTVKSAGAYGFTMASNYNTRGRAAEVMVDADQAHLVRERETVAQLFASEHLLD